MSRSQRREPIRDRNAEMKFGQYEGIKIADILIRDPQYLIWLHNNTEFELDAELLDEAENTSWNADMRQELINATNYDGDKFRN